MSENTGQGGATNPTLPRDGMRGRTDAVQMIVPGDPMADCTMRIYLGSPTVPGLIRDMTGAELGVTDGVQHVVLPNGSHLVPGPSLHIGGFTEEGIDRALPPGTEMAAALRTGNTYRKEKAGEWVPRSCVSFLVPADPGAGVVLELTIGRELGNKIRDKLYM
ncbi:hypothetical protein QBC33DRAFT_551699 [Phialemonium atrogriseum]|uniref:Uncharacterized protein n=1 Tax=Phialemonium atrogriseum TaxID=1093897 RepID=A0AAJ0FCU7_9PEZI|nr:uncharacterized protein QBC33DRAFT_551699 [Phialemonium atrogriseum]KAK1762492.1 hypothetical protein QBC33DRAFT_551699 [Phialemonium atrogriseum]